MTATILFLCLRKQEMEYKEAKRKKARDGESKRAPFAKQISFDWKKDFLHAADMRMKRKRKCLKVFAKETSHLTYPNRSQIPDVRREYRQFEWGGGDIFTVHLHSGSAKNAQGRGEKMKISPLSRRIRENDLSNKWFYCLSSFSIWEEVYFPLFDTLRKKSANSAIPRLFLQLPILLSILPFYGPHFLLKKAPCPKLRMRRATRPKF